MNVQLAKPDITQREIDAVMEVMKSGILSIGPKIKEFEKKIAESTGVRYAVAVNSGTSALHLIIKALSIGEGDEVITTSFSFVASVNCFMMEGAKPVFVDIDPRTLNMNIEGIEERITEKTKAILAVDVFGQPMDIRKLREIADKHNLYLIEDSCEAIGSVYDGDKAGSLADAAVFAFYPNKQLTTGEGGIIVTNNEEIALMAESLRSQGRAITGFWLHHERLGYNYRMSELQAALGCVQVDRLDEIVAKRQVVADMYNKELINIQGITIPYIDTKVTTMSWFVYVIQVAEEIDRDRMMLHLKENGVACRPYFTPIHVQPYMVEEFGYEEKDYPVSADIGRRSIALPFHNDITMDEVKYVVKVVKEGAMLLEAAESVACTTEAELNSIFL
jgi:perosamine synthetase